MWYLLACPSPAPTHDSTVTDSEPDVGDDSQQESSADPCDVPEICNGVDDDCDGAIDEGVMETFYEDLDGDGFGGEQEPIEACERPAGYVDNSGDCDDGEAEINPDAEEICNDGIDNDCDEAAEGCDWGDTITSADAGLLIEGEAGSGFGAALHLSAGALAIGAPTQDSKGAIFVFANDSTGELSSDDAYFRLNGSSAGQGLGNALAGLGDLDGDGSPSVAVGASTAHGSAGEVYLVELSGTGVVDTDWAEARLTASDGQGGAGTALAGGDHDGDGEVDVAVGVPRYGTGSSRKGAVYHMNGPITSSGLAGAGFRLTGPEGARAGQALAMGDLSGDGISDLTVGAYWDSTYSEKAGAVYVVEGPLSANTSLDDAAGQLIGPHNAAFAGSSLADLGDINNDGYDDLAVGVPGMDRDADVDVGAVMLVYGPVTAEGMLEDFSRVEGANAYDQAGDILGDADGALLIGGANGWVQLGPWSGTITVEGTPHRIDAAPTAMTGGAVSADSERDLVIGETDRVWVVFGEGI